MSTSKILSVIVPSYNMEKHLPKCLGSIVVAPELMRQLEVLVVNDGSKDRTSEIAHEFAAKWPGVFQVIDKENGNYGSCINAALPIATGMYVKVLDADDFYDTRTFSEYLEWLTNEDMVDLVVSDWDYVDGNANVTAHHSFAFNPDEELNVDVLLQVRSCPPMPALAYRTGLLRELDYSQKERISYTDTEWAVLTLVGVRRLRYFNRGIYKYWIGRDGQTMNVARHMRNWWMSGDVALDMVEKFERMKIAATPEIQDYLHDRIMGSVEIVYRIALCGLDREKANIDLVSFDEKLRRISRKWSEEVGLSIYSNRLPYRYVESWRQRRVFFRQMIGLCKLYSRFVKFVRG